MCAWKEENIYLLLFSALANELQAEAYSKRGDYSKEGGGSQPADYELFAL